MSNAFKIRMTHKNISKIDRVRMSGDPERIVRNSTNPSVLTTINRQGQKKKPMNTLDCALRSEDGETPYYPETKYDTYDGLSFRVPRPSATPFADLNDSARGLEAHIRVRNGSCLY